MEIVGIVLNVKMMELHIVSSLIKNQLIFLVYVKIIVRGDNNVIRSNLEI